ncbi:hypothetical protein NEOC65_001675 [Neochlamydia sp. AcF65]|nr:hypothetical protein [Neochlamydia sp. AcF65]MBS4170451.1 hypothetical protein [Neochlamydia sp. AcF95]
MLNFVTRHPTILLKLSFLGKALKNLFLPKKCEG